MLYDPMSIGRSIDEVLRVVKPMQTLDAHKAATKEN
jgi:peroxiredoxin 2/4